MTTVRIVSRGGPHDGRQWKYSRPLPDSIILLDAPSLGYHEYERHPRRRNEYDHVGFVGALPVPRLLDD